MEVRPTPTSPKHAHRYPVPPNPNVAQLLVAALAAAVFTAVIGAVVLRFTVLRDPSTTGAANPGTSTVVHPTERLREQRSSAVVVVSSGTAFGGAVAVSSDGWVLTVAVAADGGTPVLTQHGTPVTVRSRSSDPSTDAVLISTNAQFSAVPFGLLEERYLGEPVALLVPGSLPSQERVVPASIIATQALATGAGTQRSDRSPSVFLITASYPAPPGTPVFAENGDLLGVVQANANGALSVLPIWAIRSAITSALSTGSIPRPTLGVAGLPAEAVTPGTTGFVIRADGATPGVLKGSPADAAGLQVGDVVERVGEDAVTVEQPLADLLLAHAPGERVSLAVRRGATDRTFEVVLGAARP